MRRAAPVTATKTDCEQWSGRLTSEQVHALLLDGLRDDLCPHRTHGVSLVLTKGIERSGDALPAYGFVLTYDRDWVLKPDESETPAATR